MLAIWNPTRWLVWCVPENEKKEVKLFLTDKKHYRVADIFQPKQICL